MHACWAANTVSNCNHSLMAAMREEAGPTSKASIGSKWCIPSIAFAIEPVCIILWVRVGGANGAATICESLSEVSKEHSIDQH
jgi:hypothetical protein